MMPSSAADYARYEQHLFPLDVYKGNCRQWRRQQFVHVPPGLRPSLSRTILQTFYEKGRYAANQELIKKSEECKEKTNWRLTASEDKLRAYCATHSARCRDIAALTDQSESAYKALSKIVALHGLEAPKIKTITDFLPAVKRMSCPLWWRRKVRTTQGRAIESLSIDSGAVSARHAVHCSNHTLQRRIEQRARNAETLKKMTLRSSAGDILSMSEVAEKSIANPAIRRGELMTRIAGFEALAKENSYTPLFITWTCPSKMHSQLSKSGEKNPKYDGTTPKEAQGYLCKQWAKTRSACARKGLNFYGIRVAEPHHDGCPHWHMLFFVQREHADSFTALLKKYALQEDQGESGAEDYRFQAVIIDWQRGSAAGYIAKYISKNLDAYGLNTRATNAEAAGQAELWDTPRAKARRVDAWAACWGIRQFQQIGGPPVGVWRELRRIREPLPYPAIEPFRAAADEGNWHAFCSLMQGKAGVQEGEPLTLARIWSDEPGRYDEPKGWRVEGIAHQFGTVLTRTKIWTIVTGAKPSSCSTWNTSSSPPIALAA